MQTSTETPPAVRPARRAFSLMEGSWRIDRTIDPGGHFLGTATFQRSPDGTLAYRESGTMVVDGGQQFSATRCYRYRLDDDRIEVRFDDGVNVGNHFLDLLFRETQDRPFPIETVRDTHLCRLDTYDAVYRFETRELFHITFVVNGPKKAYVSHSTFRRIL
jgi:hypothetical protein